MSEKIVLTVEQDKSIKSVIKDKLNLNHLSHYAGRFNENHKSLNTLTIDQMARILYEPNSFKVEKPKFEVGEWLVRDNGLLAEYGYQWQKGYIFKANIIEKDSYVRDKKGNGHAFDSLRHATKEEIFWAELGREVGEFVDGDIGIGRNGLKWNKLENVKREYKNGHLKAFYPANSLIELP